MNTLAQKPRRILPVYKTAEAVVCDLIATEAPYLADPSGERDASGAIQSALDDLCAHGGGTLYLPRGRYLLKRGLVVPSYCAIVGDYQHPDDGNDYGTILLADVESVDAPHPALFELSGSAGVMGLTVFYPNQSLDDVKPYPFTFYCGGGMLASVQNCTVLNGYRGIGACVSEPGAHEQFTIDGFFGTFLHQGTEVYDQSDVGTWKHVDISPRFWANAPAWMTPPSFDAVHTYTKENATGLVLGDLEWTEFVDLRVDGYQTGMRIVKGKRIEFAGSVFEAAIHDCRIGLRVEAIDERWGMVLAQSVIEGDVAAISHDAAGAVKMTDCVVIGKMIGSGEIIEGEGDLLGIVPIEPEISQPPPELAVLSPSEDMHLDRSADIQTALDALKAAGGGVLYLTSGIYQLDAPITVPEDVEMRGSAIPVRDEGRESKGVLLLSDLVGDETSPALVTLREGATLSGIRIIWNKNGPHALHKTPFAVRGTGSDVRVVNCCIAASTYGIDFRACDRHHIKKLTSCCYEKTLVVGGRDGVIEGCLQNGTALVRAHLPESEGWVPEFRIFEELFPVTRMGLPPMKRDERRGPPPPHGRPRFEIPRDGGCTYLTIENADAQTVYNTFAYGVASMTRVVDSKNVVLINLGSDNIAREQSIFENSAAKGVNLMRYNGTSLRIDGGDVHLYNRLTILDKHEANF